MSSELEHVIIETQAEIKLKESYNNERSKEKTTRDILSNALIIILSFVGSFLSQLLSEENKTVELTILLIVSALIWFSMYNKIRRLFIFFNLVNASSAFDQVLIRFSDAISYLFIFAISDLLVDILKQIWKEDSIDLMEAIVSISTILLVFYSIFSTYDTIHRE